MTTEPIPSGGDDVKPDATGRPRPGGAKKLESPPGAWAGPLRSLTHWSTAGVALAVVPAAHWIGQAGNSVDWFPGVAFASSFAVFALILSAVSTVSSVADATMDGIGPVLRDAERDPSVLDRRLARIRRTTSTFGGLKRGVSFVLVSAIASAIAIVIPSWSWWDDPPSWLASTPPDVATAIGLVAAIAAALNLFPFTWHLIAQLDGFDDVVTALERHRKSLGPAKSGATHGEKSPTTEV